MPEIILYEFRFLFLVCVCVSARMFMCCCVYSLFWSGYHDPRGPGITDMDIMPGS